MQNLLVKTKELLVKNKWLIAVLLVVTLLPLVVLAGDSIGDSVQLAIVSMLKPILYYLGNILIFLINLITFLFEYNDFLNVPVVNQGWIVVRDLINMTFVLFMMAMALGTILPFGALSTYNYKSFMVKLLIAAIVINFSKTILGVIIDACQIVMLQFVSSFREAIAINLADGAMLPQLLEYSANTDASVQAAIISMIAGIVFLVIFIFVILVYALVLLYRIISLWIILMLSPLMFFSQVGGPILGNIGKELWGKFWKQVTVGITLAFFMWLALTIMYMTDTPQSWMSGKGGEQVGADLSGQVSALNAETNTSDKNICSSKACEYYNILRFIIAIVVLMQALEQAQKAGGFAGKWAGKITAGLAAAATYKGLKSYYNSAKKKKDAVANSKVGKYTTERAKMLGNEMLSSFSPGGQKAIKSVLKGTGTGLAVGGVTGAGVGMISGLSVAGYGVAKSIYKNWKGNRAKKLDEKQQLVKDTRTAKKTEGKMDKSIKETGVVETLTKISQEGLTYRKEIDAFANSEVIKKIDGKNQDKEKIVKEIDVERNKIKEEENDYEMDVRDINNDKEKTKDQKKSAISVLTANKNKRIKEIEEGITKKQASINAIDEEMFNIRNQNQGVLKLDDKFKEKIGSMMLGIDMNPTTELQDMEYMFRQDVGAYVKKGSYGKDLAEITKQDMATYGKIPEGDYSKLTPAEKKEVDNAQVNSPLVEIQKNGKRYRQKFGEDAFYEVDKETGKYIDDNFKKRLKTELEAVNKDKDLGEKDKKDKIKEIKEKLKSEKIDYVDDMGVGPSRHETAKSAAGFAMSSAKDKEMQEKSKKFEEVDDESLKTLIFQGNMAGDQKEAAMHNLLKRKDVMEHLSDDEKNDIQKSSGDSPMLSKMVNSAFKTSNDTRQFLDTSGLIDYKKLEEAFKKGQIDATKLSAGQIDEKLIESLIRAKGKGATADLQNMSKNDALKGRTMEALNRYLTFSLRDRFLKGKDVSKDGAVAAYAEANGSLVKALEKVVGTPTSEAEKIKLADVMTKFLQSNPNRTSVMKSINEREYKDPIFRRAVENVNDVTIINAVLNSDEVPANNKKGLIDLIEGIIENKDFKNKVKNSNRIFQKPRY